MARRVNDKLIEKWAEAIAGVIGTDDASLERWSSLFGMMDQLKRARPARSFALDGRYSLSDKIAFFSDFLKNSLGNQCPEGLEIFLLPLIEGDLWNGIALLKTRVLSLFDAKVGRVVVEIQSAASLSSDAQAKILEGITRFVNENPELGAATISGSSGRGLSVKPIWKVDPELIAGLEIRIGSRVWDASLSARIRELGRQLLKTA